MIRHLQKYFWYILLLFLTVAILFPKQFIKSQKRDTKNTKTDHYILLTNVSIKRCIKPSSNMGGEEFQADKYLTDFNV